MPGHDPTHSMPGEPGSLIPDDSLSQDSKRLPVGPAGYALARQDLIRSFLDSESPYFSSHKRLFAMTRSKRHKSAAGQAVWRSDMDTFLLELMRRRITEDLLFYARLVEDDNRRYIIRCDDYEDVKSHHHRGCLLRLGPESTPVPCTGASIRAAPEAPPRLWAMQVDSHKLSTRLATIDLRILLGEEHLGRLRERSPLFREGSLFLLGRRRTLELQSKLWKLHGYMA